MLVKLGVYIDELKREIRRALNVIDEVYREHGQEAVITSTYEGNHSPGSLHYARQAVDVRLPGRHVLGVLVEELKARLGRDYDVVVEPDHIHVEYDPKERG